MRLEHKEWEAKWQEFMFRLVSGRVLYSVPEIARAVEAHAVSDRRLVLRVETQPGKNPGNNKNRRS